MFSFFFFEIQRFFELIVGDIMVKPNPPVKVCFLGGCGSCGIELEDIHTMCVYMYLYTVIYIYIYIYIYICTHIYI